MNYHHRTPLRDSQHQFAGEIDWGPRRLPRTVALAGQFLLSGAIWAGALAVMFAVAAILHGA